MKRTKYIMPAMKELLIPSCDYSNLFPFGLTTLRISKESFFTLQIFPHIGDIVVGLDSLLKPILFKVKSINWLKDNKIMISPNDEINYPITKVYPVEISDEILYRLGFRFDEKFRKFRSRLEGIHDLDLEKYPSGISYYIKEVGFIKYLHELQEVLRLYKVDKMILCNKLYVLNTDNSSEVDWVNNAKWF